MDNFRPWFIDTDYKAVTDCLDRGDLMSGREVAAFEEELAAYFGKRHCVCVSSGTAALECAFVATGEGDVINRDNFIAMKSAALAAGRSAKLHNFEGTSCDVLGYTYAVYGRVHDCAHRLDRQAARADVSCFSFNHNKFIACVGGCLVTNDSVVAATARQYRNHGRDGGPEICRDGRNLRMGEINAALGRSQLKRIDEILARRGAVAHAYNARLDLEPSPRASWFLYPVTCKSSKHGFRSWADFKLDRTNGHVALLPIWPCMTVEDVNTVCKKLEDSGCL